MAEFDYANARLRAMRSRLLSRAQLEALSGTGSLGALVSELTETPYRKAIELAMARASGVQAILDGLRIDISLTFEKLRGFLSGTARQQVDVILRRFEVYNLRTLLRGVTAQLSPGDISASLIPVGTLPEAVLREIARSANARQAVDRLITLRIPWAAPLVRLRRERPGVSVRQMELVLERAYFAWALDEIERLGQTNKWLHRALEKEIDLINLSSLLRWTQAGLMEEPRRMGEAEVEPGGLWIAGGGLPVSRLDQIAREADPEDLVTSLRDTAYADALRSGLEDFQESRRVADFERRLEGHRLAWRRGLWVRDPLGVGVSLGFEAVKANEVRNLRWIASGMQYGLEADRIFEGLVIVA